MKTKLFLIAMISTLMLSAQFYPPKSATFNGVGTFSTSATSDTLSLTVNRPYATISIQGVVTASLVGSSYIQGSIDNVNFLTIGTTSLSVAGYGATNTGVWTLEYSPYEYYRFITLSTGTVTTGNNTANAYFLGSKITSNTPDVIKQMTYNALTTNTVTNTGTSYIGIKLNTWYQSVSIQAVCTKVTGTQAGTVTLQGSNDGINFVTVNTGYLSNDVGAGQFTTGGGATLTATNVAVSTKVFVLRGSPYQYYRLSWTGSGTMVSTLSGFVLAH